MTLTLSQTDPRSPGAMALLQASHALMQSLFKAEHCQYLSVDALCAPHIQFVVAYRDGTAAGCGALARQNGYGELKSMFVDPGSRGTGTADALLAHIEMLARDLDLPLLRLETGTPLTAALSLYTRHGFQRRGPFGGYSASPFSVFMEKTL